MINLVITLIIYLIFKYEIVSTQCGIITCYCYYAEFFHIIQQFVSVSSQHQLIGIHLMCCNNPCKPISYQGIRGFNESRSLSYIQL